MRRPPPIEFLADRPLEGFLAAGAADAATAAARAASDAVLAPGAPEGVAGATPGDGAPASPDQGAFISGAFDGLDDIPATTEYGSVPEATSPELEREPADRGAPSDAEAVARGKEPGAAASEPRAGLGAASSPSAADPESDGTPESPTKPGSAATADGEPAAQASGEVTNSVSALGDEDASSWQTAGDFQVLGGAAAETADGPGDFFFENNVLHIMSSTPLTVRTARQTVHTIDIDPGVKADLALAGVNIQTTLRAPINLVNNVYDIAANDGVPEGKRVKATHADQIRHKTTLHLTLADGSSNSMKCTTYGAAGWGGIRCTWGTELTIDDSVRNATADGRPIIPQNGVIPYNATLYNGKKVEAGNSLSVMDSENPGSLTITGSGGCAGIGGSAMENAGTIIINGGNLNVDQQIRADGLGSGAAAIGAGSCGSGTLTVINGGRVVAIAAHCGTGIGAGTSHECGTSYAKEDAIETKLTRDQSQGYT